MTTQNINFAPAESTETWGKTPAFIASQYEAGVSLREDIYARQFTVYAAGDIDYPEDDLAMGVVTRFNHVVLIGNAATLTEAAELAERAVKENAFNFRDPNHDYFDEDLGHDCGPVAFRALRVVVKDRNEHHALAAAVQGNAVCWLAPAWGEGIETVKLTIKRLHIEAEGMGGWFNQRSRESLKDCARNLEATLIHPRYWFVAEMLALVGCDLYPMLEALKPEFAMRWLLESTTDDAEIAALREA